MTNTISTKSFTLFVGVTTAVIAFSGSAVQASNAGSSLGACYDHVITACNQTDHPVSCSEAGMDGCDDYHSANGAMGELERIRILVGEGRNDQPTYRVILETDRPIPTRSARETGEGDDDREQSAPSNGGSSQGGGGGSQPQQSSNAGSAAEAP